MPRSYPPRRTLVGVRLAPAGLAEIDALAAAEGVDRSAMIRALLAEGMDARQRTQSMHAAPGVYRPDQHRATPSG